MSTNGLTSSLLSQIAGSPSEANQFVTDLNQVAQDIQSGNIPAARQDFITLAENALNGVESSGTTTSASGPATGVQGTASSSSANSFVSELDQLGAGLDGNLGAAQVDMLPLESTAVSVASAATATADGTSMPPTPAIPANQLKVKELVQAIAQALGAGDFSGASTDLSQLAAILQVSVGAGNAQSPSDSLGASSSSSGRVSPFVQSLSDTHSTSLEPLLSERA